MSKETGGGGLRWVGQQGANKGGCSVPAPVPRRYAEQNYHDLMMFVKVQHKLSSQEFP